MEADTAFVGADSVVVLYAVASVHLYLAVVVHPCHTECKDAVGDTKTLDEVVCLKLGMLVVLLFNRVEYLFYCLEIFWLIGEPSL